MTTMQRQRGPEGEPFDCPQPITCQFPRCDCGPPTNDTTTKPFGEGHGKPCYYCGEPCDALAGNPGRWPIYLCHRDDPGVVKWHHVNCVTDRLIENQPDAPVNRAATVPSEQDIATAIYVALSGCGVLAPENDDPTRECRIAARAVRAIMQHSSPVHQGDR